MIVTNKYQLTSKNFFRIILTTYLRKTWWVLGILGLIILLIVFHRERDSTEIFMIYIITGILIGRMSKLWTYAYSKDNKIFLLEKHFEIYEDKIVETLNDGTNSLIKIGHFVKVFQTKRFYLLYFAKERYITISKDSFKNKKDKNWFEKEIFMKIEK
jgi:lipid-A-disaccharide synthase-like uncharacterized protein